jgi:hypothetical protein
MKLKAKSFPVLLLFLFFFSWSAQSCKSEHPRIIGQKQFIEIFARLLIIDEMELSPEHKEKLRQELLQQFKVTKTAIDQTIEYYNSQPEKWVDLLAKTRDRIDKLRTTRMTQPATEAQQKPK